MTTDIRTQLRALTEMAPGLRKAGVLSVSIVGDGISATLAPAELPDVAPPAAPVEPVNALDDPDTFGGKLPRRKPMLFDEESDE